MFMVLEYCFHELRKLQLPLQQDVPKINLFARAFLHFHFFTLMNIYYRRTISVAIIFKCYMDYCM
jgi:hypothetical protein